MGQSPWLFDGILSFEHPPINNLNYDNAANMAR